MTKYEELVAKFTDAVRFQREYRQRCLQHITTFLKYFVEYAEIPPDRIAYQSRDESTESSGLAILPSVIYWEDEYWNARVLIHLSQQHSALFTFGVKEQDGKVAIRFIRDGKPTLIDIGNADDRSALFHKIVAHGMRFYDTSEWQKSIGDSSERSFGFIS